MSIEYFCTANSLLQSELKFVSEWWTFHLLKKLYLYLEFDAKINSHVHVPIILWHTRKKIIINLKYPLKSLAQSNFSTFPRLTFGLTSIIKAPKLLSDLLTCHSTRFSLTSQPGDCFTLFEQVMSKENGPLVLTQLVVYSGLISSA